MTKFRFSFFRSTFACIKLFSIENINVRKSLAMIEFRVLDQALLMIVLVAIQMLLPLLLSGPIASQFLARDASICFESWWKNLLFINNFYNFDQQVSSFS